MGSEMLNTVWFRCAFPDVAARLGSSRISRSQAVREIDGRIRVRLAAYLRRSGLRASFKHLDDILQQFWVRMCADEVFQKHDPNRGGPWPMIYLVLRCACYDVGSTKWRTVGREMLTTDLEDGTASASRHCERQDLCERIATAVNALSDKQRAAILVKYTCLSQYGVREGVLGSNEAVDRTRGLAKLRAMLEVSGGRTSI